MKHLNILFLLLIINVCIANGQRVITLSTGDTTTGVFSQTPTRNIEYIGNSIIVTYNFEKATIMEDPLYEGRFMWNYVGFGVNDIPSQPAIPFRLDSFTIPNGCYATVELVDSQFVDLPFALSPSRPPLIDSGDETYTTSNVPAISAYEGYFPASVACLSGIDVYRGDSIANVLISPLKYNYQTNTVRAYTRLDYRMSFIEVNSNSNAIGSSFVQPNVDSEDIYLNNVTLNVQHQMLRSAPNNPSPPQKTYLILSTPTFLKSVTKFADWKKLLGFNVQTIFSNSWTPSTIKSTIRDVYDDNNRSNLYYLLIVGDMEDVPSQISNRIKPHATDFYYACVDGDNDKIPDLLYGRIPVKTNAEANNVIEKIINYEKNPANDSVFYKTALHCAYFQDNNNDNYEDVRFTLTSEEIRNSLLEEGYDVIRVYRANSNVNPMYWNNHNYAYGESIPDELKRPIFSWTGDSSAIKTAINNGSFYVLHRDHGSETSWDKPLFTINNINTLNNGNKLPVVFSINCKTGNFNHSSDCFCEVFLKKPNGGCVAIFGASATSYSGENDVLAEGIFDAIWPSDNLRPIFPAAGGAGHTGGITPIPTYELGQILNQGKARLAEVRGNNSSLYAKEIFHCFGDPSMKIYTDYPTPFTNVDIFRSNDSLYVNLNGDTATIVFRDQQTGETLCAKGTSAILQTNPSTSIKICISSHNRIPYICDVEPYVVYIQNETVMGTANYNADIIKVGTHVTNTKPQGPVVFKSGKVKLQAKRTLLEGTTTVKKGTKLELINNNN